MATKAVAQERLCALRRDIARIEGRLAETLDESQAAGEPNGVIVRRSGRGVVDCLPTGVQRLDTLLGGGIPAAGLVELHGRALRDSGLTAGFALALARLAQAGAPKPLLWIGTSDVFRETGLPYAPALAIRFGLDAGSLFVAQAEKLKDVLWIAEEAASLARFQAILLELRGRHRTLDLVASRRLHRRALQGRQPLLLLRQAGTAEPTAAPVRLVIDPAPAGLRPLISGGLPGTIGPPAYRVHVDRCPAALPAAFLLEWSHDRFRERRRPSAEDPGPLVPLSAIGKDLEAPFRARLAQAAPEGRAGAGLQPTGGEHPARLGS